MRHTIVALVFLAVGGGQALGRGKVPRPSPAVAQARLLFRKAEVDYRLGSFEAALSNYKAALKLARRPSIIFNIAQCHRFLKQPEKALFFYRLYLSEWERTNAERAPNHEEVQGFIAQMQREVASLEAGALYLAGIPPGATLWIDGKQVRVLPPTAPYKLPPGAHEVRVIAAGQRRWSRTIQLAPRDQIAHAMDLAPRDPASRSTFWLVMGIASTALAVGGETTALVFTYKSNQEYTTSDRFDTFRKVAIAGHVTAGVFAAMAGVSFYLYWRSGRRSTPDVGFRPAPGGGALTAAYRF